MRREYDTAGKSLRFFRRQVGIAGGVSKGLHIGASVRIAVSAQYRKTATEEFLQIRSPDIERPCGAHANVVVDLAGEPKFPGFDQAACGITGHAPRRVEFQRL